MMSENNNETTNINSEYFYFPVDENGERIKNSEGKAMLALNEQYRGDGLAGYDYSQGNGEKLDLPDELEIPREFDGIPVEALVPGMFAGNKKVKKIRFPTLVLPEEETPEGELSEEEPPAILKVLPEYFCWQATNLQELLDTDNITEIKTAAFGYTRIKNAQFTRLTTLGNGCFLNCAYLETVHIGGVSAVPFKTFMNCTLLREVTVGETAVATGKTVTSIGQLAFANTRSLRELSWLNSNIAMDKGAFYCSGIDTSSLVVTGDTQPNAFPKFQKAIDFWADPNFEPDVCCNRLATKLSQNYAGWKGENFPKWNGTTYDNVHAFFAVMHIHSAITGKYYSSPSEFMEELQSDPKLAKFLLEANWPGNFKNVASMFEALGHHTEVHGNGSTLNEKNYLAVQKALEQGAYVYTEVPSLSYWMAGNYRTGHAVVLYGINHDKEVRVLDSNVLHEEFREGGLDPNIDVYAYTMPYQNMVGTGSRFVIVYPRKKEPVVRWTGHGETGRFFFHSMPNEYPANCVTTCCVEVKDDESYAPTPRNGILTAYLMGGYGYRTFVPEGETALYMQVMYRNEKGVYTWGDWVKLSPDTTAATGGDGGTSA